MRVFGALRRLPGFGRRLARDESGAALVYVSIALTVFMGFAALVIDGSRLFTLDTELQSAADAIALAGAAELDGAADAQTRADAAMANLVQNNQTVGIGATAITSYSRRFLDELPDDDQPITDDFLAADAASTRFVEVKIAGADRREIGTIFAGSVGGGPTAAAGATATAGFTSAVCKFTPLFICNPFEADDPSLAHFMEQFDTTAERRRIIALKKSGAGASYTPGNFGFLESNLGPGAKTLGESLAATDPGVCFRQDGVETKTGSTNSVHKAINVRFDLYANGIPGNWKSNPEYRPAKNVTKGFLPTGGGGNPCNVEYDASQTQAMRFPHDSFIDPDNRMGNGDWDESGPGGIPDGTPDFEAYWDMNHGNRDGVYDATADGNTTGWDNSNLPTRYEVYRWEIDNNAIPDQSPVGGENGDTTETADRCGAQPGDDPDRRIIYAAVLNCTAAGLVGGSADSVPVLTFLKMFMTQPMTKIPGASDEDDTLYIEMVDIVKPGVDAEVVHDIVQLYR